MLIEHNGHVPQVDPTAWVAPNAVLSGAVTVGAGSRILYGATLVGERGQRVIVGRECVIMEQAVLRGAGRFPLTLSDHVLVGPHAYLTGCTVGPRCFIATGAMIFNGARLGAGSTVALGGKVHIDTDLPDGAWIPMGFIAFGRPGRVYAPQQAPEVHEALRSLRFAHYVFGIEPGDKTRDDIIEEMLRRYARALETHRGDRVISTAFGALS